MGLQSLSMQKGRYSCITICLLVILVFIIINLLLPTPACVPRCLLGEARQCRADISGNGAEPGSLRVGGWCQLAGDALGSRPGDSAWPALLSGEMMFYRGCRTRGGEGKHEALQAIRAKNRAHKKRERFSLFGEKNSFFQILSI